MTLIKINPITITLARVTSLVFLYAFLGLYLWGIQLAYDKASPLSKAFLFTLIIFGGGLSWDILKQIATLSDTSASIFAREMLKTFIFMLLYAGFFVVAFMSLGAWAGIQTIGFLVYLLLSGWFMFLFFRSFMAAVEVATGKPPLEQSASGAA